MIQTTPLKYLTLRLLWTGGLILTIALAGLVTATWASTPATADRPSDTFNTTIETLAALGDRSTGTPGNLVAAKYIRKQFSKLKLKSIGTHQFILPVRTHGQSTLDIAGQNSNIPLYPLRLNAISPEAVLPEDATGPLIYGGTGRLKEFNGTAVDGAIILMELDSGTNWQQAAALGAKAVIYVDRGDSSKFLLADKRELSPVQLPRFWLPLKTVRELFGAFESAADGILAAEVSVSSQMYWENVVARNIYGLIPGSDPALSEELIIVEAFYDSRAYVAGRSPGADEAVGIATLLETARFFTAHPPQRSLLFLATGGHAQSLAGMREAIWSLKSKRRDIKKVKKRLTSKRAATAQVLDKLTPLIASGNDPAQTFRTVATEPTVVAALVDRVKTEVDIISRRLMLLRLAEKSDAQQKAITDLARQRLVLRKLSWRSEFDELNEDERLTLNRLIPTVIADQKAILIDARQQLKFLKSTEKLRKLVRPKDVATVISLHLSSHGDGVGAFNNGWLYALKPTINRVAPYSMLDEILKQGAAVATYRLNETSLYQDTLRPSRLRAWETYFLDRPALGGEVSALAGYLGFTLATTHDARPQWGTPEDLPERVDVSYGGRQSVFISHLLQQLDQAPILHTNIFPRNGFSTITARAKFLRHGELFADQPAPGSAVLAFQGPARYHAMVDTMGNFQLRGMASKKLVYDKVILECYRFDKQSGAAVWAIDKKQTGKSAYRVKMQRTQMETDLVMFACKQTTLFNLLEPRSFNFMTKLQLIDGRREALPLRYWYSRIDTRESLLTSIYLESGTRLKLTLSDSMLTKKMILLNATPQKPQGTGYPVDEWPAVHRTEYRVAHDMWQLLAPRIANLEDRGIFDQRIRELYDEGQAALDRADQALESRAYDTFAEAASKSWALATRVYRHVEKTQKDVLFGVLFYIALFVPFAFCMERLLFSYTNIYRRISAFLGILILLIAVIYKVHPAFKLAYSPMVVILAFFIIGLSLMVSLIIFFRFEEEMGRLQSRAGKISTGQIGYWKAFVAAFFLGVSNLRRRRLRTALTCLTLIILTFTIMSFTSVKSNRSHGRLLFQAQAPYQGLLLKKANWLDLPTAALLMLETAFEGKGTVLPRVWLEDKDRTRAMRVPVRFRDSVSEAQGLVGLSARDTLVTGGAETDKSLLTGGRWFSAGERRVALLSAQMARNLGIDPQNPGESTVSLWGLPHRVVGVFDGKAMQKRVDLDGEPFTPVIFPTEVSAEMTEVEMEALESGEDIQSFQSRYQHVPADLTLILPYRQVLAAGGRLKGVAVLAADDTPIQKTAEQMVDRFGLLLFSGEPEGSYLYHVSDTMSYSGVPNIVIPLIISIFIVLNTMISSVYERKREIGIYTSVGLAPSHVSFLFVAEALAFAVISVVLGYLLAQTTAKFMSQTALWAGITVNYSSLAGVGAMILVILVVLISVIYPSRVAGQVAIPDINRTWKLPEAQGNLLELTLPFLMQFREYRSIGGFLYEYFQAHQDISHGIFSTGDISLEVTNGRLMDGLSQTETDRTEDADQPEAPALTLLGQVWLAPFDFGIMQDVALELKPAAEEAGFLEIRARLIRKAGEANAWWRINKVFLFQLRRQLLIWRSLDENEHQRFATLLEAHQQRPQADVPPQAIV